MKRSRLRRGTKKVIMRRMRSQEEKTVPLCFGNKKWTFLASVVGSQGDTRMKLVSPKGRFEVGFPFADFNKVRERIKDYAKAVERHFREQGYDVEVKV